MSRRRSLTILVPLALLAGMLGAPAPVLAVETGLLADLDGAQEVPGPGAPDGIGGAELLVDPDAGTVCWIAWWQGIGDVTAAHIHAGALGAAGAAVVTLTSPYEEGCVDSLDGPTLQAIVDAPADYYVNLHTADYPAGALRGQLYRQPVQLFFELDGSAEVPGPGDGDGDGRGSVEILLDTGSICYYIETLRLGIATAAHIHSGAEGVSGAAAITLDAPVDGYASNCSIDLDTTLLASIIADPSGFYVNVHTDEFPAGAIRGQLSTEEPVYPTTLFAGLSGDEEVPGPGDPGIGGMVQLEMDIEDGYVCAWWSVTGVDAATAAHVHEGAAGVAGSSVVTLATPFETTVGEPCTFGLDPATLQAIADDPAAYYVNVHTDAFPGGAGRGQLSYEPPPPPPCAAPDVCDGPLGPGAYVFGGFGRTLSFTLDEEWMGTVPGDGFWLEHPSGETGIYVANFGGVVGVPPCGTDATEIDIAAQVLADWLAAHSALDASAITGTSLGGLDALSIDITGDVPAECETRPYLVSTAGSWFRIADGEFVRVFMQDVASTIVVFVDDFDGVDVEASLLRAEPVLYSMMWGEPIPAGGGGGDGEGEGSVPNTAVPPGQSPRAEILLIAAAGLAGLTLAARRIRRRWA